MYNCDDYRGEFKSLMLEWMEMNLFAKRYQLFVVLDRITFVVTYSLRMVPALNMNGAGYESDGSAQIWWLQGNSSPDDRNEWDAPVFNIYDFSYSITALMIAGWISVLIAETNGDEPVQSIV